MNQVATIDNGAMISMIERAARDPSIDINKLERLIALQEKAQERAAEQAFNSAMSDAQGEMTSVAVDSNNPQTRSRYASYFALDKALRPIYSKHGFALSFGTGDIPQENYVRVLCYASHRAGFTRTYHIDMPADGKGAKGGDVMTKTHATGSAMSYGQRYLLKMIFNISVGSDDDGNAASPVGRARVPSPGEAAAPPKASPEPPQAPHQIKCGKDADDWTKLYLDAVLTSDSPDAVFKWVDLNKVTLKRLSADHHKTIDTAVQKHLEFLRKTDPKPAKKNDPISSGLPPKDPEAILADIDRELGAVEAADDLQAVWDTVCEPLMAKLDFPPDRDAAQGLFRKHEKRLGAG